MHNNLSPQRLALSVLQHQGQAVACSWQWPAAGEQTGFDAILAGVQGVDAELLAQARDCRLVRAGPALQPVWILRNNSHELACSVNQQMLAAGSQLRLDHGDEIELGLTRLRVSLEPAQEPPLELSSAPARRVAAAPDADRFELTELDALSDPSTLTEGQRYGLQRSDFGDLISLMPELQTLPAPALLAPAVKELGPVEVPALDPLQALHSQYLAKLRDPVHGDDQDLWSGIVRGKQSSHADPMQQWMQAAGPGRNLDDLLGQSHSIASVMDQLDALGAADVLAPEPFDSVMHLFAPAHLREPVPDARESLEALVQRSLPGLTRREHHSMSLDSAMPFTGGEEPPPQPE